MPIFIKKHLNWPNFWRLVAVKAVLFVALMSFFSFAHATTPVVQVMGADNAQKASIKIEMAETPQERETGLMNRKQLAPDTGMLFVFEKPMQVKMWMKSTLIPLDMLFADWQGQIFHVEENVQPLDLTPRGPDKPDTLYVLELPAGTIKKNHILIGDVLAIPEKSR